jgi:hypothetical protein
MTKFYAGLDLGQLHDHSALVIVERQNIPGPAFQNRQLGMYNVVLIRRFKLGMSYPAVVADLKELLTSEPLLNDHRLVADGTGVGVAVVDLLRQADLKPVAVTITSGSSASRERGVWHVPKKDLIGNLQVLFQTGRIKIPEGLPETAILTRELLTFRVKITISGNDIFGSWRESEHDDLVLALALAVWFGERFGNVPPFDVPTSAPREPRWPTFGPPDRGPYYWHRR